MEMRPQTEIQTETLTGWRAEQAEPPAEVIYKRKSPFLRGLLILFIVLAALAGAGTLAYQNGILTMVFHPMAANPKLGHFYSTDSPEMSTEGIKGVITEAYYTNDKRLALILTLSNGLSTRQYLTSIDVTVKNEDGKIIASGSTDTAKEDFSIKPLGTGTFTFYISPKYVQIPNDDLGQLSYVITTTGKVEDVSVLTTAAPTTAGTTTAAGTTSTTAAGTTTKTGTTGTVAGSD